MIHNLLRTTFFQAGYDSYPAWKKIVLFFFIFLVFSIANIFFQYSFFEKNQHCYIHTKCSQVCKKAICCHNCFTLCGKKSVLVLRKLFVQVTLAEKGHRGNILRLWLRLGLKNLSLDALFQPR